MHIAPLPTTRPANNGLYLKDTGLHRPDEALYPSDEVLHQSNTNLHGPNEVSCSTAEESRSIAELLIQLNQGKLSSRQPLDKPSVSDKPPNGWAQDACSYGRNDAPPYRSNLAVSSPPGQSTRQQPVQPVQPVLPRSYQHNNVHYIQVPVMSVRPRIPRWRMRRADYVVYGRSPAPQPTNQTNHIYGPEPMVGEKRSATAMLKNVPKSPATESKTTTDSATLATPVGLKRFKPYQEDKWMEHFLKFKEENDNCLVPGTQLPNPLLARWVRRQRKQYKNLERGLQSTMTPERIDILNKEGFVWESHARKWMEHFQQLLKYKEENGNCLVPNTYPTSPLLARWVKRQRRNYKLHQQQKPESTMTPERIELLNKEGFVWSTHEITWMKKFYELTEYRAMHGHCRVQLSKMYPQLASWVKSQRKEYRLRREGQPSTMTAQRINLLDGVGFLWDVRYEYR